MKAAQDSVTNAGHLIQLTEAFWQRDVVPQIDEAVPAGSPRAEYERYLTDPERPAFLQLLRTHEIGGRSIEDSLDAITGRGLQGAHSIAGVLHGRLEKAAPPARGQTTTFAERVPGGAAPEIGEGYQAADARQAEIGRQLAGRPEEWAAEGVGAASGRSRAPCWTTGSSGPGWWASTVRWPGSPTRRWRSGPCRPGRAVAAGDVPRLGARPAAARRGRLLKAAMGHGDLEARLRSTSAPRPSPRPT